MAVGGVVPLVHEAVVPLQVRHLGQGRLILARACGSLINPRSRAETTAHRCTPMLAAEV